MVATRELGVVYTPPAVTAPMVEKALAPLVAGKSAAAILELRICDPAVGTGAFAIEVIRILAERVAASPRDLARAKRVVAERCVCGVDVDARAVAEARATGMRAIVGDALALDWAAAFPDAFARGGFDAVVGNPPYIRQERLADKKPALRGFEVYDGVADLYVYFVELAHRIVRRGGRYCLVLPNKWMTAAYGRPLRNYLAARGSIEGLVDFGGALPLFAGADAFPCIVWGGIGDRNNDAIRATRARTGSVAKELATTGVSHARARWRAEPWHIDTAADRTLIERLETRWPALGDIAGKPSRGVVTGCNRAFVIDGETRNRLVAASPVAAALVHPFVKGRDVRPWSPVVRDRHILLVDRGTELDAACLDYLGGFRRALEPRPPEHRGAWAGRKPGTYRWYELQDPVGPLVDARAPRLLYQDIQTEAACCLDRDGALVPDTTVWMLPCDDLVVLAILNSSLYRWYARRRFPPALNGAVRPKREYIRALPIARPGPSDRRTVEALVERRLGGPTAVRRPIDVELDDAVLELYGLTRAERRLIT